MTRACRDCKHFHSPTWAEVYENGAGSKFAPRSGWCEFDEVKVDGRLLGFMSCKPDNICDQWEPWATVVVAGKPQRPLVYYLNTERSNDETP